jgi:hypothetical protein
MPWLLEIPRGKSIAARAGGCAGAGDGFQAHSQEGGKLDPAACGLRFQERLLSGGYLDGERFSHGLK